MIDRVWRWFQSRKSWLVYAGLIVAVAPVYGLTLARDYTWKHWGSDAGDLIASIYTLGIPHPPGTPAYVLLLQPFRLIPFGTPAFKMNLASGFFALLAVLVLARAVMRLTRNNQLAAVVSGLYLAFSSTFWSQAVITEVLTLHALLSGLVVYSSINWELEGGVKWKRLSFFFLGLALANHTSSLMLAPAIGYLVISHFKLSLAGLKELLSLVFFLALGLVPYLYLPLRARVEPPLDWGRPDSLARFINHISSLEYHQMLFYQDPLLVIDAAIKFISSLANNLTYPGLLLAATGLILGRQKRELKVFTGFVFLFQALFVSEYKIANIETFNLAAFWVTALWIGLGIEIIRHLLSSFREALRRKLPVLFLSLEKPAFMGDGRLDYPLADLILSLPVLILAAVPLIQVGRQWSVIDASHDREAAEYGRRVFEVLKPGAIVFTEGDKFSLVLDYQRWVVHPERQDVAVMVNGLYLQDWRLDHYRKLYPELIFPDRPITTDPKAAFADLLELIELNIDKHPAYLTFDYPPPKPDLTHRITVNNWIAQSEGPIYRLLGKIEE